MHGRRELRHVALLALVAVGVILALIGAGANGAGSGALRVASSAWRGLVGESRPAVSVGQRMVIVMRAPSLGDRVGRAGGRATDQEERRWTAAALASQNQLLAQLATHGIRLDPEFRFARVLNGFSAAVTPEAVALLERSTDVAGVYPVRAAYPASIGLSGTGSPSGLGSLPGRDGHGVTIALLDTGVDSRHVSLLGRLQDGVDVIGGGKPSAQGNPHDRGQLERHGSQMAGLLVGTHGVLGIAPGASIFPIRVAGWQPDATGKPALYARTDQLLEGLEHAVDPNGDGDAHDAARVALVPLAEPFAAFAESPEARAVAGATQLDTLVVVPAGNDGPAGPSFGSISGPGGAPAALTVGAVDSRAGTLGVRVVLRAGLRIELDRVLPLAGGAAPRKPIDLDLAVPGSNTSGSSQFFDARGFSLVAGRAILVNGGSAPETAVRAAARAGAGAVLLYGEPIPPGGIGSGAGVSIPVVALEGGVAPLLDALRNGAKGAVTIGAPRGGTNASAGRIASFSSRGLAFDGRVKPELVAPGVGLATVEPGGADHAGYGSVNGSSAAAAVVAGAAALLVQARPDLDAGALKSFLVNTGSRLENEPIAAQGGGLVDIGAAAAAEVAAQPVTLTFGRATSRGWRQRRSLVLRNFSSRALIVTITTSADDVPGTALAFRANPARVRLRRHGKIRIALTARALRVPGSTIGTGTVEIAVGGGEPLHVPWSAVFGGGRERMIGSVRLSAKRFHPSDTKPAVLALRVGRVFSSSDGTAVRPLARLDVQLLNKSGRDLGFLARLRDLLPGGYALGLTGRDPGGHRLKPGRYRLRLVAVPTGGGAVSRRSISFAIR